MAYSSSWVQVTPGTTITITVAPALHDVALVWAVSDNAGTTWTSWPTGFTQIASQATTTDGQVLGVAIKPDCDGTETSWSIQASTAIMGGAVTFSGRTNTNPHAAFTVNVVNSNTSSASPRAITSDSVTPSADGVDLVAFVGTDITNSVAEPATVFTTATGTTGAWTTQQDVEDDVYGFRNMAVGSAVQTTAGEITVTGTSTFSVGNAGISMVLVGLLAAGGATTGVPVFMNQYRQRRA